MPDTYNAKIYKGSYEHDALIFNLAPGSWKNYGISMDYFVLTFIA